MISFNPIGKNYTNIIIYFKGFLPDFLERSCKGLTQTRKCSNVNDLSNDICNNIFDPTYYEKYNKIAYTRRKR